MSLWPEEYEAFRAEAREMAVKLAAAFAAFVGDAVPSARTACRRRCSASDLPIISWTTVS